MSLLHSVLRNCDSFKKFGKWTCLLLIMMATASSIANAQRVTQTNLVADTAGSATTTDPNLVNPWGISFSPTGAFWLSDNHTGLSTLYDGTGAIVPLVVTIPSFDGSTAGSPTGTVFNGTSDFVVSQSGLSGAAVFLFATEDGTISGWAPSVNFYSAVIAVNNGASGAVYKGLAFATQTSGASSIYAANFHDGVVEQYDSQFRLVRSFTDPTVPAGYAPYNVQAIGNKLYVTFALQDADKHDDVPGPHHGYVDIFDFNGNKLQRFASQGPLNSPWGVAEAPDGWGKLSHTILIGNFGDGHITSYGKATGKVIGQVLDRSGKALVLDGLWALSFGNGSGAGATNELFFTAGPNGESNGLFGKLTVN